MKKVNLVFVLNVFLLLVCGNMQAQPQNRNWSNYAESFEPGNPGDGSPEKPYVISSGAELAYLGLALKNGTAKYATLHYQLGADIDLNIRYWDVPIGMGIPFQGTFDGAGHRISNMNVTGTGYLGLFAETKKNADIKNVNLENCSAYKRVVVGCLIGYALGTEVENCSVKGYLLSDITNCAGGLIGEAHNTIIKNCSASGKIIPSEQSCLHTGGFIGYGEDVECIDCFSEGVIVGENVGGFIAYVTAGQNIFENCYSTCKTNGTKNVGGFIGYSDINAVVEMTGCRAYGSVVGLSNYVGGFFGRLGSAGTIRYCLAEGTIKGSTSEVGGFIGMIGSGNGTALNSEVTISYCRSTGATEALSNHAGGFIGSCVNDNKIIITGCSAESPVTGTDNVGGFVGYCAFSISASGCSAYGAVEGNDNVGGFGGRLLGAFSDCYTAGAVKGNENIGGFTGNTFQSEYTNCYTVGAVSGNNNVGGFIGIMGLGSSIMSFSNCYTAGAILCEKRNDSEIDKLYGAFIGNVTFSGINNTLSFTNCYFDRQTTGLDNASGVDFVAVTVGIVEALPTSELTKNLLPAGFPPNEWIPNSGYYPQLKTFAKSDNDAIRLRSALSVVPLKLASNETVHDVQKEVRLVEKTPDEVPIKWNANPVIINATAWNELTLSVGDAKRTVFLRSKNMSTSGNYLGAMVNKNIFYNTIPEQFTYTAACNSKEESVYVEILNGGFASCTPVTSMILTAKQPQTVTAEDESGETKYILKMPLPSDIYIQRWNDVLAINNNFTTNGGYHFTAYKWYKNYDELQGETKGYLLEAGGLKPSATYTAEVTTQGNKLSVCPAVITQMPSLKMSVYPNPVRSGQSVYVETGITADKPLTGAVMQLFTPTGNLISKQTLHQPVAEIAMPETPGQYLLQITVNGAAETFKIVVE